MERFGKGIVGNSKVGALPFLRIFSSMSTRATSVFTLARMFWSSRIYSGISVFIDSICALWFDAKMSNIIKIPASKCWDVKIRIMVNNKSFPIGELFKAFNALNKKTAEIEEDKKDQEEIKKTKKQKKEEN